MILPERVPDGTDGWDASTQPPDPAAAIQHLWREADGAQLTCGLSEPTRLPEQAPQALRQAEHAIDLGMRIGRAGQAIRYEELGIYRLLLGIGEMSQLWQFAEEVLGPLIDYDARHTLDLIGTLSVYLSQRESLKQTARVLRVHVNTVSYRIQRIERLTSLNLGDPDDRLSAHVATKIIESLRAGDSQPALPRPAAGVPRQLPSRSAHGGTDVARRPG